MFDNTQDQTDSIFDPYAVLGVAEYAGPDEITRARNALLKEHRDALGTDPTVEQTEKLRRIIEAHDILANPATRRAYDLGRRARAAVDIGMNDQRATLADTLAPTWADMFGPVQAPAHWNRPENSDRDKDRDADNILTRIFGI